MRQAKQENAIEVQEDFHIPGTDVILEAGDRIKVLTKVKESNTLDKESIRRVKNAIEMDDTLQAAKILGIGEVDLARFLNADFDGESTNYFFGLLRQGMEVDAALRNARSSPM